MGIFRNFPYSNFHEMNMDEIIKNIKTLTTEFEKLRSDFDKSISDMFKYIKEYLDNIQMPHNTSQLVNDSGFITIADVPTKTSELTNDSGFLTSAPVTSVNGQTGTVVIAIPTSTSQLSNNGDGASEFVTTNYLAQNDYITAVALATPTFKAADATSKAVLQQAFGVTAEIVVPSNLTSTTALLYKLEPRTWFCWMNGTEMEFARMSVSANTGTGAITLYLRGRTSIATGIMGVDSSWNVH